MGAESDVEVTLEATPRGPQLSEACALSEAHRRRLYADELAFVEREFFACLSRQDHLRQLIGRESSMYLGGSSEQKELRGHPRPYFCPYYWTERARQLIRADEEEVPRQLNLYYRRCRLLEKLEHERLCIVDRGDGTKREYECVPASAEARFRAGWVHEPEQNIGRAPCTDEAGAKHWSLAQMMGRVLICSHLSVPSDMPGTLPDPLPEAPLMEAAQQVRLRPPRSTQVCAV